MLLLNVICNPFTALGNPSTQKRHTLPENMNDLNKYAILDFICEIIFGVVEPTWFGNKK